jgi:hypothetical protein
MRKQGERFEMQQGRMFSQKFYDRIAQEDQPSCHFAQKIIFPAPKKKSGMTVKEVNRHDPPNDIASMAF